MNINRTFTFAPYFDGYFQNGNFYSADHRLLKRKVYNGRIQLIDKKKRWGIKTLRLHARISNVKIEDNFCPF